MCFVELVGIFALISQRDDARAESADARSLSRGLETRRKIWEKRARQLGWGDSGFNGVLTDREGAA